jgi:anti-sigma28 factor (negative regulator of flagellin synthesis)
MKISLNNSTNHYTNLSNVPKPQMNTSGIQNNSNNFDAITIQSNPTKIAENKFATTISTRLSSEIRQPATSKKIDMLKSQVENGTYQINPKEIASKMLLLGKEHLYA